MSIETAHVTFVNSATGEVMEGTPMLIPLKARIKDPFLMVKLDALSSIALDKDLKYQDLRVLLYYLSLVDFENSIPATQAEVSIALEMRHSAVSRSCKKLIDKGILTIVGKQGRSNTYTLNAAYAWRGKINEKYYAAIGKSDDLAYEKSGEKAKRCKDLQHHKTMKLVKSPASTAQAEQSDDKLPILEYLATHCNCDRDHS